MHVHVVVVVQLAITLPLTPFIAAITMQLAFDCLVFMFSLMLLPGQWHRCDCLVEKQPAVKSLVFA